MSGVQDGLYEQERNLGSVIFPIKVTLGLGKKKTETDKLFWCPREEEIRINHISFTPMQPLLTIISLISFTYRVKKMRWSGGAQKKVVFKTGQSEVPALSSSGSTLTVSVALGLPNHTRKSWMSLKSCFISPFSTFSELNMVVKAHL